MKHGVNPSAISNTNSSKNCPAPKTICVAPAETKGTSPKTATIGSIPNTKRINKPVVRRLQCVSSLDKREETNLLIPSLYRCGFGIFELFIVK